jgi:hypothetical protein
MSALSVALPALPALLASPAARVVRSVPLEEALVTLFAPLEEAGVRAAQA